MRYSVWNQGADRYDYYQCPRQQHTLNVEPPTHLEHRTLGSTVDQAAWPLPSDAVLVGHGTEPVGRIATRRIARALGDAPGRPSWWRPAMLVGAAYLLWRYVVPPVKRTR